MYAKFIVCRQTIYSRDIVRSHAQRERRLGARYRERKESSPLLRPSQICHSHARSLAPRFARHFKRRACVITTWRLGLRARNKTDVSPRRHSVVPKAIRLIYRELSAFERFYELNNITATRITTGLPLTCMGFYFPFPSPLPVELALHLRL